MRDVVRSRNPEVQRAGIGLRVSDELRRRRDRKAAADRDDLRAGSDIHHRHELLVGVERGFLHEGREHQQSRTARTGSCSRRAQAPSGAIDVAAQTQRAWSSGAMGSDAKLNHADGGAFGTALRMNGVHDQSVSSLCRTTRIARITRG
jgi:hypothetical protein